MEEIFILCGGKSSEREVSIVSAKSVASALESVNLKYRLIDPNDYEDLGTMISIIKTEKPRIVFNGLHGGDGENGNIQALFEMEGIPFTGSGSLASKIAMDKYVSKLIAKDLQIPVPEFILLNKNDHYDDIKPSFGFPCIVKPNSEGSSFGISIVHKQEELIEAIKDAFNYDNRILIEEFIEGRELTVAVLGDRAYSVVEIIPRNGWYDYNNKYTKGNTEYICPADLTSRESNIMKEYALELFHRINCRTYCRMDFRYDGTSFYFLEANTLPGMTSLSLTPMSVKNEGVSFIDLIEKIINYSV